MYNHNAATWFHSNRYNHQDTCEHCGGVVRHETWCITIDPTVYYAYQVVLDPTKLTLQDSLILHSLGVAWSAKACGGKCKTAHS